MVKVYVMNADNEGLKRTEIDADLCVVSLLRDGHAESTQAKDLTSARGARKRSRKRASYKSPERSQT